MSTVANNTKSTLLCLFSSLLIVSILSACASETSTDYIAVGDQVPFSNHKVPIYPGAQGTHVRGEGATQVGGSRFIYFQTDDAPELVIAFYKEQLPKDGWLSPTQPNSLPGDLYFYCCEKATTTPEFQVTLKTLTADAPKTEVVLALTFHPR